MLLVIIYWQNGLGITIGGMVNTITVPATIGCNGWFPTEPVLLDPDVSPAGQVSSSGFASDKRMLVVQLENGTFDAEAVQLAIDFGDSLVMNQNIPECITMDDAANSTNGTLQERAPVIEQDGDLMDEKEPIQDSTGIETNSGEESTSTKPAMWTMLVACIIAGLAA